MQAYVVAEFDLIPYQCIYSPTYKSSVTAGRQNKDHMWLLFVRNALNPAPYMGRQAPQAIELVAIPSSPSPPEKVYG